MAMLMMPTRPPERLPKEAPNLFAGSWERWHHPAHPVGRPVLPLLRHVPRLVEQHLPGHLVPVEHHPPVIEAIEADLGAGLPAPHLVAHVAYGDPGEGEQGEGVPNGDHEAVEALALPVRRVQLGEHAGVGSRLGEVAWAKVRPAPHLPSTWRPRSPGCAAQSCRWPAGGWRRRVGPPCRWRWCAWPWCWCRGSSL